MTGKEHQGLLKQIENKIYNQVATQTEKDTYIAYVHFLELFAIEIQKISLEVSEKAYANLNERLMVEEAVIN